MVGLCLALLETLLFLSCRGLLKGNKHTGPGSVVSKSESRILPGTL